MNVTIYAIKCLINDKIYIGQTNNYKVRMKQHLCELKTNKHTNKWLQHDFNIYGIDNFKYYILESNVPANMKYVKETFYMNMYGGTNSDLIYNVKGNFHDDNTEYAQRKVSHLNDNYNLFEGKVHTEESKLKISQSLKQAYQTGKHQLAGAVAGDCSGENNSFYGKHHTEETKQKLSHARTKYDQVFVEKLRKLKSEGKSVAEIGRQFNISSNVAGMLINYGTTSRKVINKLRELQSNKCND